MRSTTGWRPFTVASSIALLGLCGTGAGRAATPTAKPADLSQPAKQRLIDEFSARFKAANPHTRVDRVSLSPIKGLFEVAMGKNLAYVDATARYALFGNVFDLQGNRDLTADRRAELDRVDVDALPRQLAHRVVKGNGQRVLFSFADPQCGYCKVLEQTLQQLGDATVYTFVMPLLGPESRRLARAIACAADPAATWSALMLQGLKPTPSPAPEPGCEDKVDAVEKLAASLGVSGTPTLISSDGRKQAGALTLEQLNTWLSAAGRPR